MGAKTFRPRIHSSVRSESYLIATRPDTPIQQRRGRVTAAENVSSQSTPSTSRQASLHEEEDGTAAQEPAAQETPAQEPAAQEDADTAGRAVLIERSGTPGAAGERLSTGSDTQASPAADGQGKQSLTCLGSRLVLL